MSWEIVFVAFVLFAALVSFILERVPTDVTALTVFSLITIVSIFTGSERLPGLEEILGVFANPAPLTIAAMFIVSAALGKCHLIEAASGYLTRLIGIGYRGFLLVLVASVALISAFVNNTPVVVVFLPVVMSLAKSMNISSSKLLIPMSYASIFGGCCTLVGTSTNVLASGIMGRNEIYPEMEPLGMFELAKVGLPLFFVATGYLALFSRRLLPDREALTNILSDIQQKEFLTEAIVLSNSSLDGKTVDESGLSDLKRMRLLDVCREGSVLTEDKGKLILRSGDRLILSCKPSGIVESRNIDGLDLLSETTLGLEQVSSASGVMVEGVIGPASPLISLSIREIDFRKRHNVAVVAIHRKGRNLTQEIDSIRLRSTDTLLLLGSEESIENIRLGEDLILLDHPPVPVEDMSRKAPVVIGVISGIVGFSALGVMPIAASSILGVAILFLTGCIKPKDAYASVEWNILVLIYGMLTLGLAMKSSGASNLIAEALSSGVFAYAPEEFRPFLLLGAIYLTTAVLTEILSNNATIVLMAPISLELASKLSFEAEDARSFILATCIAASASFMTPIGYQTNTYVYSVGGYRFRDFVKIGLPLNLLYFLSSVVLIGCFWEFPPFEGGIRGLFQ
jgi:di/tricarboxylate transporter